jgi:hypothetical protein
LQMISASVYLQWQAGYFKESYTPVDASEQPGLTSSAILDSSGNFVSGQGQYGDNLVATSFTGDNGFQAMIAQASFEVGQGASTGAWSSQDGFAGDSVTFNGAAAGIEGSNGIINNFGGAESGTSNFSTSYELGAGAGSATFASGFGDGSSGPIVNASDVSSSPLNVTGRDDINVQTNWSGLDNIVPVSYEINHGDTSVEHNYKNIEAENNAMLAASAMYADNQAPQVNNTYEAPPQPVVAPQDTYYEPAYTPPPTPVEMPREEQAPPTVQPPPPPAPVETRVSPVSGYTPAIPPRANPTPQPQPCGKSGIIGRHRLGDERKTR